MMDINTYMRGPPTAGISISHDGLPKLAAVHCYDRGNIATFALKQQPGPYIGEPQAAINQKIPLKRPLVNQPKIYSGEYYPAGSQPRLQFVGGRPILLPSTFGNKFIPKAAFNPDINHSKSIVYNDPIRDPASCKSYTSQDTRLKFHDSSPMTALECAPDERYCLPYMVNSERNRRIHNYVPPGETNQKLNTFDNCLPRGSQIYCPEKMNNIVGKPEHHNSPLIDIERREMIARMDALRTQFKVDALSTAINAKYNTVNKSYNNLVHSNGIRNNQMNKSYGKEEHYSFINDQQQQNKELYPNNINGQGSINPYTKETNSAILNGLSNRLNARGNYENNYASLLKKGTMFRCNWCQNKSLLENSHIYIDDTLKTSSAYNFTSTLLCSQCAKTSRVWDGMRNVSVEYNKPPYYDTQLHENGVSPHATAKNKQNNVNGSPIFIDLEDPSNSINRIPSKLDKSNMNPNNKDNNSSEGIRGRKIIPTSFYGKDGIYDDNVQYFPDNSRSPYLSKTSSSLPCSKCVTPWKKYRYTENLTPNHSTINSENTRKTPVVIDLEKLIDEENEDIVKPRESMDTSQIRETDEGERINVEISDGRSMSPKNSNVKENPSNPSIRKEEVMNNEVIQVEWDSDIKDLNIEFNDEVDDPNIDLPTRTRSESLSKCNTSSDTEIKPNDATLISPNIRDGPSESNTGYEGNTGKNDESNTNELRRKRKVTCENLVLSDTNDEHMKICDHDIDEQSIKSTPSSPIFLINKENLQNDKSNPSSPTFQINKEQLEKLRSKVVPILKAKKWIRENSSDMATAESSESYVGD